MFFDVYSPSGKKIIKETFSRSKTKESLKKFVKIAIDQEDYFIDAYLSYGHKKDW